MIRRLAADPADPVGSAGPREIARILGAAFDDPAQRWSPGSVASTLAAPGVVGLLAEGGCAVLRVAADEAELLTIAVLPAARGRGLGAALLDACLAESAALGARRLHLEVAAANSPALALYARAGFVETGRRRGYYGAHGDALTMARVLG